MVKNTGNSLIDRLGREYCEVVSYTAQILHGLSKQRADELISSKVDFFPDEFKERIEALSAKIGEKVFEPF